MDQHTNYSTNPLAWGIGLVGLLIAVGATCVLVLSALGFSSTLPGCGPESGCAKLTSGPWSALPLLGWPVSFVGLAYFGGLLLAWLRGSPSKNLLWVIRLGILISLGFVLVMISQDAFCRWCLAAHLGNLITWITAEILARRNTRESTRALAFGALGFALITVVLAILLPIRTKAIADYEAQKLAENQSEIAEGTTDSSTLELLKSRHIQGAVNAPVQVVMFTDYQCPDCFRLEGQMSKILEDRDDVSLAIKHFPFCAACNEHTNGMTMHPNACWAARAAEAAQILGGDEGFRSMHNWLFEERGRFTDSTFPAALQNLGFDPQTFIQTMTSQETLDRVRSDTDDAVELGLFFTPMIFINGVEYTWYYGGNDSLSNTIALAAQSQRPAVAPLDARERLFEDWRIGRTRRMPGIAASSWLGDGEVEVVVYGDYQSESSQRLDRLVREQLDQEKPIRYTWRHYPLEMSGNSSKKFPGSEAMARLVEAARHLGGEEARWKLHVWLMEGSPPAAEDQLTQEAADLLGIDQAQLLEVMNSPKISTRIARDMSDKRSTWSKHLPVLVIDDRLVPRWASDRMESDELIAKIVSHAHQETEPEP